MSTANGLRRQLGRRLRLLRERAGLTLDQAAPALDWSTSKLSRIENGQQVVDVHGVRSMLDLYDVGGAEWTELVELARRCRQRGWWRAYGLDDKGYVPLEAAAVLVRDFTLCYVPGLLQTAGYARALFTASLVPRTPERFANDLEVRLIRQRRLISTDDRLRLEAVIDESVLYRPVGDRSIMAAQLEHLIDAAAWDTVSLQVLPIHVGPHPAMDAVFTVLSFPDPDDPDIAYVEHAMGAVQLTKERDAERAKLVFDRLRSSALSPHDSVTLIQRVLEQCWRESGGPGGARRRPVAQEQL